MSVLVVGFYKIHLPNRNATYICFFLHHDAFLDWCDFYSRGTFSPKMTVNTSRCNHLAVTLIATAAFSQEKVKRRSSSGVWPSRCVSTLSHNNLQLGVMTIRYPSSPGPKLNTSLLPPSLQQPSSSSCFPHSWEKFPARLPTSSGNRQPSSLQCWTRSWYFLAVRSGWSSWPPQTIWLSLVVWAVWASWRKCSFLPRSTLISHDAAVSRRSFLVFLEDGRFSLWLMSWI